MWCFSSQIGADYNKERKTHTEEKTFALKCDVRSVLGLVAHFPSLWGLAKGKEEHLLCGFCCSVITDTSAFSGDLPCVSMEHPEVGAAAMDIQQSECPSPAKGRDRAFLSICKYALPSLGDKLDLPKPRAMHQDSSFPACGVLP